MSIDEIKIYFDTCCYNRPFDIQDNEIISRETKAKLYIQALVKYKALTLVTSFVLAEEVGKITTPYKRNNISDYINDYGTVFVAPNDIETLKTIASNIIQTGIKTYDAMHVACAIYAGCSYFITTDKRLLKYNSKEIQLLNPFEFLEFWEGKYELR
jgi:predicted nucleic acid-binding protein